MFTVEWKKIKAVPTRKANQIQDQLSLFGRTQEIAMLVKHMSGSKALVASDTWNW
jgi:hypothetical protein